MPERIAPVALAKLLTFIVILAVILVALRFLVRRLEPAMAFFPTPGERETPADFGTAFEAATILTSDGEQLRAWILPHDNAEAEILYLHGNGGNLSMWNPILVGLQRQGYTVFAIDYRGYGSSTGRPSEQGLYRDVDAAVEWFHATRRSPDVPAIYWGRSLGVAMAAWGATRRPPDGLILEAGFPDVASLLEDHWVLRLLLPFASYRFPAAEWLAEVRKPVLVMHGTQDRIVPLQQGERLFERIDSDKTFFRVEGAGHNDLMPPDPDAYWRAIRSFIRHAAAQRGGRSG